MQGIIFKIIGGTRAYELRFIAMSNQHAQMVAHELHASLGLIGRHYVELDNGFSFTI
jgi:hypothetical protein